MVGTNPTTIGWARQTIRDFFLLDRAEKKSAALSASQIEAIRTYHAAATRRIQVADESRGPVQTPAAVVLYEEASLFYALAYMVSADGSVDPRAFTAAEAFRNLDDALAADGLAPSLQLERVRQMLVGSDPLRLDRVTADEASVRIEEVAAAARWLGRLVDPRSQREIKKTRARRLMVGTAAGLALLAIVGIRILAPKNLALYRPAVASSCLGPYDASAAVDGFRLGRFYHSEIEESPWLSIDLGRPFAITRIEVFGRTDGPFDQSIPLALEVSDEGTDYRALASRTEPFSDYDPWVVTPPPPVVTRYLRLRTMRRSYLVVGEVEVYGTASNRD